MLTELQRLSVEADGRYATPEELEFLKSYLETFRYRISAYQKLQKYEPIILQKIHHKLIKTNPQIFMKGSINFTSKWRLDTIRVLRYSAMILLINDPDYLQERLLIWFATILQAFKVQDITELTYQAMSDVLEDYLTPEEKNVFFPLIELNLAILCKKRTS
ncbi:globin family protein [Planktothrix mougeotii]|uniref:Phycobilisome protein n=1 Tax=Planktothrix mougeotii LEGE 06226 TaxID=1828728 RepID=A0ABR9UDR4_9CYAN|nr:phycobilisome protein [Planktothrix mougeotii]MBE9144567.1 phycobilisome protein [Planktothrix mougeotii LEGE 06226]